MSDDSRWIRNEESVGGESLKYAHKNWYIHILFCIPRTHNMYKIEVPMFTNDHTRTIHIDFTSNLCRHFEYENGKNRNNTTESHTKMTFWYHEIDSNMSRK